MFEYGKNDCIFKFLILMYQFNKDLKKKIKNKSQGQESYYLINANFLKRMKETFNYNSICNELEKHKYNDYKFDSKIPELINIIKQKKIVNTNKIFDKIGIKPKKKNFFQKHF